MNHKLIKNKIEKILKNSKKPLDQIEISEKIKINPFIIDDILHDFERRGLVISQ